MSSGDPRALKSGTAQESDLAVAQQNVSMSNFDTKLKQNATNSAYLVMLEDPSSETGYLLIAVPKIDRLNQIIDLNGYDLTNVKLNITNKIRTWNDVLELVKKSKIEANSLTTTWNRIIYIKNVSKISK